MPRSYLYKIYELMYNAEKIRSLSHQNYINHLRETAVDMVWSTSFLLFIGTACDQGSYLNKTISLCTLLLEIRRAKEFYEWYSKSDNPSDKFNEEALLNSPWENLEALLADSKSWLTQHEKSILEKRADLNTYCGPLYGVAVLFGYKGFGPVGAGAVAAAGVAAEVYGKMKDMVSQPVARASF